MASQSWIFAAAGAALLLISGVHDADARGRRVEAQGARGGSGWSQVERGQGFRDRQSEWTGAGGRTRSVDDQRAWSRSEGTYSHDRDTAYRDGTSRSVDSNVTRTAPGQYELDRSVTGRNGETRTQTGEFSAERTENGRSITGAVTGSNGGSADVSRDVSHENGVRSVNSSATFGDGSSVSRASSSSCADGVCSSHTELTNRQGGVATIDQSRSGGATDLEMNRDITYADGSTRSVDRVRDGNGDGTGVVTRTVTGRNGQTHTQTGAYQVTPTP